MLIEWVPGGPANTSRAKFAQIKGMLRIVLQMLRIVECCIQWMMPRCVLRMLWKAAGCGMLQTIWMMRDAECVLCRHAARCYGVLRVLWMKMPRRRQLLLGIFYGSSIF